MKPSYFFQNPGSAHLRYYVLDLNNVKLDSVDVNISPCTETYSTSNDSTCNSYSWNGSTYNVSGAYSYYTTNSNGCDSIATLNLIVNSDSFDLDFSVDNQGFTSPPFIPFFINLSANMQEFDFTWDWGDGTQTQSNNVNVFHEYLYNGLYEVKLVAENNTTGCKDTLAEQDYIFTSGGPSVSITEVSNQINIFPNPTNENVTISINNFNGNIQTEVYDLIGNMLQVSNETTISLQDYAKGIYLLKVSYGDRVEEVKVIKD
jgi:PKD repeat protein